ncbi:hypothetical protein AJ80_05214 [Polytolypa hystricis UAMH7299]|uniref:DUF6987 domain-containing protein n=1 Tax=Polytolypa hystricis (strain UAMH7299) TaxID=1447883 RepID=A0A2B7XX63_POLH7|nr:hypothetical protein AJ80_05214 [Polytolypa hystricis UAMH7299]
MSSSAPATGAQASPPLPTEEGQVQDPQASLKEGQTEEDEEAVKGKELAKKMSSILQQTLDKVSPLCRVILEHIEKAERTPKDDLDEEQLVKTVKPLLEEGNTQLQECNGALRALDPDGSIAANAKAKSHRREATPEEYQLADLLKELTSTVVTTIDKAKKTIEGMPHAKKELSPLWALLSEPLGQIIGAVGLLLAGVLNLVGKLLNGLGLGTLVNNLLSGLGLTSVLNKMGMGSVTEALGLAGSKK